MTFATTFKQARQATGLTLEFCTTEYRFAHGRNPSGRGRWAFAEKTGAGDGEPIFAPSLMTLTEAKKWFRSHLVSQGITGFFRINVCS